MMEYPSKQAKGYLSPLWADFRLQKKAKWKSSGTIPFPTIFIIAPFVVILYLLITIPAVAIIHPLSVGMLKWAWRPAGGRQIPSYIRKPSLYGDTSTLIHLYTNILQHLYTYTPIYTFTQYTPSHLYTGPLQHSILYTVMKWSLLYCQEEESIFWIAA